MNSISSGITASSILKSAETKKTAEKNDCAAINTKDTVEKASDSSELKKSDFLKMSESTKKGAAIGASIGGVAGGIAGGIVAHNLSSAALKEKNEFNTVSVDWQQPEMQNEKLGNIPADFYNSSSKADWAKSGAGTTDIYGNNPVQENGAPLMKNISATYSDYGTPVVKWETKDISQEKLSGYSHSTSPDVEQYQKNGSTYERIKGFEHKFQPNIESTKIGSYQVPNVSFKPAVNVTLNTALGVLAGAGIGALAGGIAGAAIAKAINN